MEASSLQLKIRPVTEGTQETRTKLSSFKGMDLFCFSGGMYGLTLTKTTWICLHTMDVISCSDQHDPLLFRNSRVLRAFDFYQTFAEI